MSGELEGKVALVTGGSRGIGKSACIELAGMGADIAVNYNLSKDAALELVQEIKKNGVKAAAYQADVGDLNQIQAMFDQVLKDFGKVDILVNNAGMSPKKDGKKVDFFDFDFAVWQRVMDVNLNSIFYCSRLAAEGMVQRRWGKIVNVASLAGRFYSKVTSVPYGTTKTAVIGLTRAMAGELAPYNINVNAVAPGRIATEMIGDPKSEVNQEVLRNTPIGRLGEARDIAKAISFLVSEGSSYMIGATLDITGGRVIL